MMYKKRSLKFYPLRSSPLDDEKSDNIEFETRPTTNVMLIELVVGGDYEGYVKGQFYYFVEE